MEGRPPACGGAGGVAWAAGRPLPLRSCISGSILGPGLTLGVFVGGECWRPRGPVCGEASGGSPRGAESCSSPARTGTLGCPSRSHSRAPGPPRGHRPGSPPREAAAKCVPRGASGAVPGVGPAAGRVVLPLASGAPADPGLLVASSPLGVPSRAAVTRCRSPRLSCRRGPAGCSGRGLPACNSSSRRVARRCPGSSPGRRPR